MKNGVGLNRSVRRIWSSESRRWRPWRKGGGRGGRGSGSRGVRRPTPAGPPPREQKERCKREAEGRGEGEVVAYLDLGVEGHEEEVPAEGGEGGVDPRPPQVPQEVVHLGPGEHLRVPSPRLHFPLERPSDVLVPGRLLQQLLVHFVRFPFPFQEVVHCPPVVGDPPDRHHTSMSLSSLAIAGYWWTFRLRPRRRLN